jgi:hypothetical protein
MTIRHGLVAASLSVLALACGSSEKMADPDPAPTATPTPAPTPVPTASATPRASTCQLPSMPDHPFCAKTATRNEFKTAVNVVIDEVVAQRPDLFDFTNDAGGGSWLVVNRTAYLRQIQNRLSSRGFCATEGGDEIGIKNTNEFNEQWNVITSRNYIRRAYISTCSPAAF